MSAKARCCRNQSMRGSSACLAQQVDLVERQDDRRRDVLEHAEEKSVPPPTASEASTTSPTTSTWRIASTRRVDHPHVQAMQRPVDARRVDEHELRRPAGLDAEDAPARGLRLVRHDRDLAADQRVEQRGLAGVGPADERDVAGLHEARGRCWARREVTERGPWLAVPALTRAACNACRACGPCGRGGARLRAPRRPRRRRRSVSPARARVRDG